MYDEIEKNPATKTSIDAIEALRDASSSRSEAVECPIAAAPASATAAPSGPTPIDGVWQASFTEEELAASPSLYDAGEINDGNWGDSTLTFDGAGRVTFEQTIRR